MRNDFWNKNASAWAQVVDRGAIKSREVTNPAILDLILKSQFASVLDVGCGEGWLARHLPESISYLGIDGSQELIEIAKNRSDRDFETVSYESLIQGQWSRKNNFDAILFNFSLLDKEISPLLERVQSFLSARGKIIIQTVHPCFKLTEYEDGWVNEDFKSTPVTFKESMPWFGRRLSSWSQTFKDAQLVITNIIEPSQGELPTSIIFVLEARPI